MCTKMSAPACLAQREHWTPCRVTCECACMRACACERARAFARVRACAVVEPYPSGPIPDVLARPHVEAPIICGNLRGVLIILLQSIKKSSDDINHTHSKSNSSNSTSCMVSPAQLTKLSINNTTGNGGPASPGHPCSRRPRIGNGFTYNQ